MFRESFKYYKSKKPPPSFDEVLDFEKLKPDESITKVEIKRGESFLGLKPPDEWEVYNVLANEGLIFIRNPFTGKGQKYWIARCLRDYPKKPNKSNLDPHDVLKDGEDWWEVCQKCGNKRLLDQLRWITFGYHHNWDTKVYSEDNRSQFPEDLNAMCKYISNQLSFKNFEAEAAIVNYYHMDSTLSGHTDHSEQNLEAPLFSFSFGQTAIFLLGGKTIDIKPTALFLHSGDIVIMSKEARLSYHGVPRIIQSKSEPWESNDSNDDMDLHHKYFAKDVLANCDKKDWWLPYSDYLKTSRININARQVLNRGEKRLRETYKVCFICQTSPKEHYF